MPIQELYLYTVRAQPSHYGTMNFKVAAESREKAEEYIREYCAEYYKTPTLDPAESKVCDLEVLGVMRTDTEVIVHSP